MAAPGRTAADLAERLLAGDKRALARAISLVEDDDPEGWALVRRGLSAHRPGGDSRIHRARLGSASPRSSAPSRSTPAGRSGRWRCYPSTRRRHSPAVPCWGPHPPDGALPRPRGVHPLDGHARLPRGPVGGDAAGGAADGRLGEGRRLPRDGGSRAGGGRHHRPRGHGRARADARLGRLDPGAQGGRHGDPRRDRGQQVRPSTHRHDDPRGPRGPLARPAGRVARADRQDGGLARRGDRGAVRADRRASSSHRGRGDALRAQAAQPDERGDGAGGRAAATPARGVGARGRGGPGAARRGGRPPARPGQRGHEAARARDERVPPWA